jgi:hypothetical protein
VVASGGSVTRLGGRRKGRPRCLSGQEAGPVKARWKLARGTLFR